MPTLLLELFSEEIPARMQADAAAHLASALEKAFAITPTTFVTPRRLAAIMENLHEKQPDFLQELKGPKHGARQAAIDGFLKKTGLKIEQLELRDGVYFATVHQKGRPTIEVLKETIEKILAEFPWPKSMRWGTGETAWVRPLHNILCLFGNHIAPIEFAGLTANNSTYGHRFLAPEKITIHEAKNYEQTLFDAKVIALRASRRSTISDALHNKAQQLGVMLHPDEALLDEVTGLVEWPVILAGKIDESYMDLPEEVLILEMKHHQKYFATRDKTGALSPYFLITANMETADGGKAIIAGNERVLRARFADGRFFWDQDRKIPLDECAKKLTHITYHAKLGSVADKVERVTKLALQIAKYVPANEADVTRASALAKADLVSGMVGEFPELQGVMGRYYALAGGEKPEVADAIYDHYKPQGPSDRVPTHAVSICIALADKLDTLSSMFSIGEKPTGSKDPFALRRAALGVIRIILENTLRIRLGTLVSPEVVAFIHDRLIVQMKEHGLRHDVIKAVTSHGDDDVVRINARAQAVQAFLATDDGANLLAAYKRAKNMLEIEEKKDAQKYCAHELDANALIGVEEKALAAVLHALPAALAPRQEAEQFTEAMSLLAGLRAPLDAFFEHTLVNAQQPDIRTQRLRLLSSISELMNSISDFSLIEATTVT